jgi:hypothetical protein
MLAIVLLLLSVSLTTCENDSNELFNKWKRDYNRQYKSVEAEQHAVENWLQNKENLMRDQPVGWTAALGKYADMSDLEFSKSMLMRKKDGQGHSPQREKDFTKVTGLSMPKL